METIQYTPRGVCSRHMEIDVEGGVIQGVRIMGGCNGNLKRSEERRVGKEC